MSEQHDRAEFHGRSTTLGPKSAIESENPRGDRLGRAGQPERAF